MSAIRSTLFCSVLITLCHLTTAASTPVQVAEGIHGIVAAGHPDATAAGIAILQAGGNAVDAAVAVSLALGVAEPYGSGIGGKLSLLYRDAATGRVTSVEGLDVASRNLDPAIFRQQDSNTRKLGPHSVAIPGLVAGLIEAHQRWGNLPLANVVEPAVKLAEEGFVVHAAQVRFFRSQLQKLRNDPELSRLYLPGGQLPVAGRRLVNEDLGRTLRRIGQFGHAGLYEGPVAEAIVSCLRESGSPIDLQDFANFRAVVEESIHVAFRGHEIHSAPPPVSGGGVVLLTLAALDGIRLEGTSARTPSVMDQVMRVFIEANARGLRILGDAPGSRSNWEAMLQPDQLDELRRSALADSPSAQTSISLLEEPDHDELQAAETTHFVVIDGAGNIVSATQSLSLHFGAGMVVPGTGIVLNNTLSNFNTISGSPNEVAPGRRPRTTISPTIIVREGRPVAALGLPGGARIPSAVVQVVVDHLQFGTPLEAAIGAPRFHGLNRTNLRYETERETDDSLVEALHSRFNWQNETNEGTETFGGFNAAEILPDGRLRGFADQRRSNAAMGF